MGGKRINIEKIWRDLATMAYESRLGMSNCFHTIDEGLEDKLRENEGKLYAQYAGWDFWGGVWFEDDKFHCQVNVHHYPREEIEADSLKEIMEKVSDKYGYG